jgi:hypothetical protein
MARAEDLETILPRREADRLFREDASRLHRTDPRLVAWFGSSATGSDGDHMGRMLITAFAVFCIVGGISMALGATLLPALVISAIVFVAVGIVARLF